MSDESSKQPTGQERGLIVQQEGKPQQVLAKFLNLLLNYQYGLSVDMQVSTSDAAAQLNGGVCCVFVIQNQEVKETKILSELSKAGEIPLFLILPEARLGTQMGVAEGLANMHNCSWQKAFSQSEESLQHVASTGLDSNGIGDIFQDIERIPYPVIQQRVERRLKNINTLPTLPEIIMRMVNDPKTTTEELEAVLLTDPSIVMKLLQVMKSPIFAGTVQRGSWSLNEIIVRLGLKKVGAIAQQIKLINSLVKPAESKFDLRGFWEHSVGCAIIADKLYTKRLLGLKSEIPFNDYWVTALLHDAGKLVLGFFFWDWFTRVVDQAKTTGGFRRAEARMGDTANHERLGQLLLFNADMGESITTVVGNHHSLGDEPDELACLVHMANNLSKELGLSYLQDEEPQYNDVVLEKLEIGQEEIDSLKETLAEDTLEEVKSMVDQCL